MPPNCREGLAGGAAVLRIGRRAAMHRWFGRRSGAVSFPRSRLLQRTSRPRGCVKLIRELWESMTESLAGLGSVVRFLLRLVAASPRALLRLDLISQQIYNAGALSLVIIMLSGLFVGMVLGLQGFQLLQRFGSEDALRTAATIALVQQLAPALTARR